MVRGAANFLASTLATAKRCGAGPRDDNPAEGLVIARAGSAFFTTDMVAAASRVGARFSILPSNPAGQGRDRRYR